MKWSKRKDGDWWLEEGETSIACLVQNKENDPELGKYYARGNDDRFATRDIHHKSFDTIDAGKKAIEKWANEYAAPWLPDIQKAKASAAKYKAERDAQMKWSRSPNGSWSLAVNGKTISHMDPVKGTKSPSYAGRIEPSFKGKEMNGFHFADENIGKRMMEMWSGYDKEANAAQKRHDAQMLKIDFEARKAQSGPSRDKDRER